MNPSSRAGGSKSAPKGPDQVSQLYVRICEAQGFEAQDGLIYCVATVDDLRLTSSALRTPGTTAKTWPDEQFIFHVRDEMCAFELSVWCDGNFLGELNIPLFLLAQKDTVDSWYDVAPMRTGALPNIKDQDRTGQDTPHTHGRIRLILRYYMDKNSENNIIKIQAKYSELLSFLIDPPNFALLHSLCEIVDVTDLDTVCSALVRLMHMNATDRPLSAPRRPDSFMVEYEDLERHELALLWLQASAHREIDLTQHESVLFRSNSPAAKMIGQYLRLICKGWVADMLGPPIDKVRHEAIAVELDPFKIKSEEDRSISLQQLVTLMDVLLTTISEKSHTCPAPVRVLFNSLKSLVSAKFPTSYRISIGGFVFLRLICPALVTPYEHGLTSTELPAPLRRSLVLASKVLQSMASGRLLKEEFMLEMNPYIEQTGENARKMNSFIDAISMVPPDSYMGTTVALLDSHVHQEMGPPRPVHPFNVTNARMLSDILTVHRLLSRYLSKIENTVTETSDDTGLTIAYIHQVSEVLDRLSHSSIKPGMPEPPLLSHEELVKANGAVKLEKKRLEDLIGDDAAAMAPAEDENDEEDEILNDTPSWTGPARDLCDVADRLVMRSLTLYLGFVQQQGAYPNWDDRRTLDKEVQAYRAMAAELTAINIEETGSYPGRLTFWINVYNAMMIHLHFAVGPPRNRFQRKSFFNRYKYRIGKYTFNLGDIKQGVLRGNPKLRVGRHRRFRSNDPRRAVVLPPDPRVYFAISNLTVGSPYPRIYYVGTIEEQLQRAGEVFLKESIDLHLNKRELVLPALMGELYPDFGKSKEDIIAWLFQFLDSASKLEMMLLLEMPSYHITYKKQSWDPQLKVDVQRATARDEKDAQEANPRTTWRRSIRQVRMLTDRLSEGQETSPNSRPMLGGPMDIPVAPTTSLVHDPQPFSAPTTPIVSPDNELERKSSQDDLSLESVKANLQHLRKAILFAVEKIKTSYFTTIWAGVSASHSLNTIIEVAKSIRGIQQELKNFHMLGNQQIQVTTNSVVTTSPPTSDSPTTEVTKVKTTTTNLQITTPLPQSSSHTTIAITITTTSTLAPIVFSPFQVATLSGNMDKAHSLLTGIHNAICDIVHVLRVITNALPHSPLGDTLSLARLLSATHTKIENMADELQPEAKPEQLEISTTSDGLPSSASSSSIEAGSSILLPPTPLRPEPAGPSPELRRKLKIFREAIEQTSTDITTILSHTQADVSDDGLLSNPGFLTVVLFVMEYCHHQILSPVVLPPLDMDLLHAEGDTAYGRCIAATAHLPPEKQLIQRKAHVSQLSELIKGGLRLLVSKARSLANISMLVVEGNKLRNIRNAVSHLQSKKDPDGRSAILSPSPAYPPARRPSTDATSSQPIPIRPPPSSALRSTPSSPSSPALLKPWKEGGYSSDNDTRGPLVRKLSAKFEPENRIGLRPQSRTMAKLNLSGDRIFNR